MPLLEGHGLQVLLLEITHQILDNVRVPNYNRNIAFLLYTWLANTGTRYRQDSLPGKAAIMYNCDVHAGTSQEFLKIHKLKTCRPLAVKRAVLNSLPVDVFTKIRRRCYTSSYTKLKYVKLCRRNVIASICFQNEVKKNHCHCLQLFALNELEVAI